MLTIRKMLPTVVAVMALVLVGCESTPTQRSSGEYIDDTTITAKVKTALIHNPDTSAMQIDIETYRGDVQLNGFVDSNTAKEEAEQTALGVEGVRVVHNNLQVRK